MAYSPGYAEFMRKRLESRLNPYDPYVYLAKLQLRHPPYLVRKGGKELEHPVRIEPARPFLDEPVVSVRQKIHMDAQFKQMEG